MRNSPVRKRRYAARRRLCAANSSHPDPTSQSRRQKKSLARPQAIDWNHTVIWMADRPLTFCAAQQFNEQPSAQLRGKCLLANLLRERRQDRRNECLACDDAGAWKAICAGEPGAAADCNDSGLAPPACRVQRLALPLHRSAQCIAFRATHEFARGAHPWPR